MRTRVRVWRPSSAGEGAGACSVPRPAWEVVRLVQAAGRELGSGASSLQPQ